MSDPGNSNFSNILKEIIKKSLFTERQIEIILKSKNLSDVEFTMTKGAYYRQVSQSREQTFRFVLFIHSSGHTRRGFA